tara:strand:+ start:451 stop:1560 length:1110 start_codon:yes stop_codon:yes gene_type:complete
MNECAGRLYLLDLARAFAAISVVLQHYQHFYFGEISFIRQEQPFFDLIGFVYKFGSQAVPFFFMLSGFIFFNFYLKKIARKEISFTKFMVLRFSRLYPLHLLTLILVILFQQIYFNYENDYFIYKENNLINFFQHLFLVQEWPFSISAQAFNHPSFSISVELFLYISFFFISLRYLKNLTQTSIISLIALVIYYFSESNLNLGIFLFFYGGVIYYLVKIISNQLEHNKKKIIFILIFLNLLILSGLLNDFFLNLQLTVQNNFGGRLMLQLYFIKFPLVIVNLTLIQVLFKNLGKKTQIFGDISYTVYLVHFPIQLVFYMLNKKYFELNYNDNLTFIIFIILVFIVSLTIYKIFELPAKKFIRRNYKFQN